MWNNAKINDEINIGLKKSSFSFKKSIIIFWKKNVSKIGAKITVKKKIKNIDLSFKNGRSFSSLEKILIKMFINKKNNIASNVPNIKNFHCLKNTRLFITFFIKIKKI